MGLVVKPDYERATQLYREIEIATDFLHCSHGEYKKLSKDEQLKLLFFYEMKYCREEYYEKQRSKKQKRKELEMRDKQVISKGRSPKQRRK